ncbi:MAG: iron(III) transport system permease protein, partial [Cognaticolwellia sp.]
MRVWLERVGLGRLLVLGCSGLLLLVFVGGPLGVLLIEAIGAGPQVWSGALGSAVNRQAAVHTLQLAVGTLAFTLVLGIPLGWLFGASDLPKRDTWRALCTLPYVIPPYIGAIAWIHLANPSSGALNKV